jgi:hypothetical protein
MGCRQPDKIQMTKKKRGARTLTLMMQYGTTKSNNEKERETKYAD